MDNKILLDSSKNILAVNGPQFPVVELQQKARVLPYSGLSDTIDRFELYNEERDACNRFRLFFTINSICSNVLFNMRTEVVYREGSKECKALVNDSTTISDWVGKDNVNNTSAVNRAQAIRDTEYSHPQIGQFVYHCGLDIFNNHMLRTDDFIHINKLGQNTTGQTIFNTIEDVKRDKNGNDVKELLLDRGDVTSTSALQTPHLYQLDNIKTFQQAIADNLSVKNGWYGFINKAGIDIPNGKKGESINKIMNNNMACEIYNMYPDISLFSFVPKMNKYRKRLEKNWNYCLTYPSESDETVFTKIMGGKGIKVVNIVTGNTSAGDSIMCLTSMIKHNLKRQDKVFVEWNDGNRNYQDTMTVLRVGDLNGKNKDISFILTLENSVVTSINSQPVVFRRLENGCLCRYYFRKFSKLGNYASELNKLAYGENIYGDRLTQLAFSDTIDVTGFKDNLGRPLSEIYLTIVKNNKGNNRWYGGTYDDETIEFSHCFGPVTSGLNVKSPEATPDYNVRKQHLVNSNPNSKIFGNSFKTSQTGWFLPTVNGGTAITIDDEWFYGDIVEYNPTEAKETVLEPVYYRFNTYQREDLNNSVLSFEELETDDYDTTGGFTIHKYSISGATIQPEGYFYAPHQRVKLREISEVAESYLGALIDVIEPSKSYKEAKMEDGTPIQITEFSFKTTYDYDYILNDTFALCNVPQNKIVWGFLTKCDREWDTEKKKYVSTITLELSEDISYLEKDFDVLLTDGSVPTYASYLPTLEKFIWRRVLAPSETTNDSDVYDMPFSNGSFYIQNNVNFFLRRQDPFGDYGLNITYFTDKIEVEPDSPTGTRTSEYYENYGLRVLKNIVDHCHGVRFNTGIYDFVEEIDNICI